MDETGHISSEVAAFFRYGVGFCEQRLMDEHIQLRKGESVEFEHDFCDHNLNNLSWFCRKHVDLYHCEAVDLLDIEFDLTGLPIPMRKRASANRPRTSA